ncbi:GAF and ANTAR domain-containing protein [Ornithinimicrobium cryptoxanthini]|uniref:GAF and ANTAR domain-containing protein n=1 Tax=Ornithinimicrobium cryptoxanthini TaxID=2934161 RepID=UPI0021177A1C|nr:GAF and ANTAR domain-containing protein [Ornithinimicrobium cryptoxanthini]
MEVQSINDRMAYFAREVRVGDDVEQAADRICEAAVDLLGGQAQAGITIAHRERQVESIGATAELVRRGDELQAELGQGPCLDAAWDQEQVVVDDLAREARWPRWGPRMVQDFGVKSMLCTQLFTNEKQLGALNIYSTELVAFDEEAQEVARLLAVHAAMAIAQAQQVEGLRFANDRRTTIGKALGIVMVTYDLDDAKAFDVLRRLSSHENRKLFDLAQDIINGRQAAPRPPQQ